MRLEVKEHARGNYLIAYGNYQEAAEVTRIALRVLGTIFPEYRPCFKSQGGCFRTFETVITSDIHLNKTPGRFLVSTGEFRGRILGQVVIEEGKYTFTFFGAKDTRNIIISDLETKARQVNGLVE